MNKLKKIALPQSGLYLVRRGQSLRQISEYFGIPEHIIILRNRLTEEPKEGDAIFLPSETHLEYCARVGDTLDMLCKKYSFSREQFVRLNGIDYLWPHMRVLLPRGSNN